MNAAKMTLEAWTEALAAGTATPGGGSAAALGGSLAASLVEMVARITVSKMKDPGDPNRPLLEKTIERAEAQRLALLALVDEDSESFERVITAYRMPKSSDAEAAARNAAIEEALKNAASIPAKTAEACAEVLDMAQQVAERGIRSAVSDAGTAAGLAETSLHSALLNVDANLKQIHDERFRSVYHKKRMDLAKQARDRRRAILAIVEDWIRPD